ncbi:MAG: hypothetical protein FWD92_01850 [Methanomassiliicoccaceae archaeon]|nr:hypothetical protein [Methanomassiliicoccaceae archaeon]
MSQGSKQNGNVAKFAIVCLALFSFAMVAMAYLMVNDAYDGGYRHGTNDHTPLMVNSELTVDISSSDAVYAVASIDGWYAFDMPVNNTVIWNGNLPFDRNVSSGNHELSLTLVNADGTTSTETFKIDRSGHTGGVFVINLVL